MKIIMGHTKVNSCEYLENTYNLCNSLLTHRVLLLIYTCRPLHEYDPGLRLKYIISGRSAFDGFIIKVPKYM